MLASWCLLEEVMILSESSEKVVWELNELLAAQQRRVTFLARLSMARSTLDQTNSCPSPGMSCLEALKLM